MTLSAWFMMIVTWSVISCLTVRFLWKTLANPPGLSDPAKGDTP